MYILYLMATDSDISTIDLSTKKKKSKKNLSCAPTSIPIDDFDYNDMLCNVYRLLRADGPELIHKKILRPPEVMRLGSSRTAWINFSDICATLKRNKDHVQSFFLTELSTSGSLDVSGRFIIKGKYLPKQIETLLRHYVQSYAICPMCRSLDTDIARDAISRLHFLSCNSCGAQRTVAPIQTGFHAITKDDRKK